MGKKTTTAKTAAPAKRAAKPTAAKPPAARKKATNGTKPAKAAAAPKRGYTNEDVALRAYFIGEKRRNLGLPGDERHDWLEAERQLVAESKAPKKSRAAKA